MQRALSVQYLRGEVVGASGMGRGGPTGRRAESALFPVSKHPPSSPKKRNTDQSAVVRVVTTHGPVLPACPPPETQTGPPSDGPMPVSGRRVQCAAVPL